MATGLSTAQINVLRKLTQDADFRVGFFKNPQAAAMAEGLIGAEASALAKITPSDIDGLHRAVAARGAADGTSTLVYAVAFAAALALLLG